MQFVFRSTQRFLAAVLCTVLLACTLQVQSVFAAGLTSLSDTMSNSYALQTGVNHTISFTTATTSTLERIAIQFTTTSGSVSKPAHLDLNNISLASITGAGTGWTSNISAYATGGLYLANSGTTVNSGSVVTFELDGLTNSAIDDCQPSTNDTLTDTCSIDITTYSDNGITVVDSGTATYTVIEDPVLTFNVEAVSSGTTHNGITTTQTSTSTTIPFGRIQANSSPEFIAHKLTITTNAPRGYTVNAYLADNLKGSYNSAEISPFGAVNATWSTPQLWSSPTGTTANSDTGWIGANTTDGRVSGWSSASQKFGPISVVAHAVATSTGPDRSGTVVYVTYGLEVNAAQPSDTYTGNIIYDVQARY